MRLHCPAGVSATETLRSSRGRLELVGDGLHDAVGKLQQNAVQLGVVEVAAGRIDDARPIPVNNTAKATLVDPAETVANGLCLCGDAARPVLVVQV